MREISCDVTVTVTWLLIPPRIARFCMHILHQYLQKSGEPVPRRRLSVTVAAVAVSMFMAPWTSYAAGVPQGAPKPSSHLTAVTTPVSQTGNPGSPLAKTYSSKSSTQIDKSAATVSSSSTVQKPAVVKPRSATGTVIYVSTPIGACGTDSGNGTAANPYCKIQDALNAAAPGDTISVTAPQGYFDEESLTDKVSDISIVATNVLLNPQTDTPALTLDDVSGVTVSGFSMESFDGGTVMDVVGSSGITLDSDSFSGFQNSPQGAVLIDGSSSNVIISRSAVSSLGAGSDAVGDVPDVGILIESGAQNIDVASDLISPFFSGEISAAGVSGLDVVGNTIQRSCAGAILVGDDSTGVSIENNVIEDANPKTSANVLDSWEAGCQSNGQAWAPDVDVDASSASATTADYNDFYFYGTDSTAAYDWAGTSYSTLADFQSAVTEGAHDTLDTVEFAGLSVGYAGLMDAIPAPGSASRGSANTSAPGALSSDYLGVSPYNDRGAIQFYDGISLFLASSGTTGYNVGLSLIGESIFPGVSFDKFVVSWGDGTTTTVQTDASGLEHDYAAAGTYTISVVATDNNGYTTTASEQINVKWVSDGTTAALTVSQTAPYTVSANASGSVGAVNITKYSFNWGDGTATTGTSPTATHTYVSAGNYTVQLTVTDADGYTAIASTTVVIAAFNDEVTADLKVALTSAYGIEVDSSKSTSLVPFAQFTIDWGDETSTTTDASIADHTYAVLGTYTVTLTVTDVHGQSATTSVVINTLGSEYTAYGPVRLLDTRVGIGAPVAQIPAHGTVHLRIANAGPAGNTIPADVTAVVLNITVTNPRGSGFITAYDDGDPNGVPTVSNVNYVPNQTVPNLAIVPVGIDGDVALYNGGASAKAVDLIADVTGYFTPSEASGYVSMQPTRLVDTRNGTGAPKAQLPKNGTVAVQIEGADNGLLLPPTGVTAVALNVTVTNPRGAGFLTVYPAGASTVPNASNLNYSAGQTIANSVIVPVGTGGKIDITNGGAAAAGTDVIVDVVGYYTPSSAGAYAPIVPYRALDTRSSNWTSGPLANGPQNYFPLGLALDSNYQLAAGVSGIVMNATVTETAGNGFLTVAPDPNSYDQYVSGQYSTPTPPNSSNLNWTRGETVPNLVQVSAGSTGVVDFNCSQMDADL